MATRYLTVGEVARRTGLAVSAVHFYESKGLITSLRNASNHRRYTPGVLHYLSLIKYAQRLGIPLDEIREVAGQYRSGDKVTKEAWQAISSQWKARLDERIDALQRLRDELDCCIGCGCLSLADCPALNPDDELAEQGTGAVVLERRAREK
ncbi:MAG: redox-sensitive transcriptional activator SoxR [Oceanospirillaceae bacterium]|nr:redox-sensitive transcriptional activator SoxR [Oceanospirillaceae bacterium]